MTVFDRALRLQGLAVPRCAEHDDELALSQVSNAFSWLISRSRGIVELFRESILVFYSKEFPRQKNPWKPLYIYILPRGNQRRFLELLLRDQDRIAPSTSTSCAIAMSPTTPFRKVFHLVIGILFLSTWSVHLFDMAAKRDYEPFKCVVSSPSEHIAILASSMYTSLEECISLANINYL